MQNAIQIIDRQRRASITAAYARWDVSSIELHRANRFEREKREHAACTYQAASAHEAALARRLMGLE